MVDSESGYDASIGQVVIRTNGRIVGIGNNPNNPVVYGEVRKRYNSSNGVFELIDDRGRVVGFVPKILRGGRLDL